MAGPYLAESFDVLSTADVATYYQIDGTTPTVGAFGRGGSPGIRFPGGSGNIGYNLSVELSNFVMGFAVYHANGLGGDFIAMISDGHLITGGNMLALMVNADGSIEIRQGVGSFGYLVSVGSLLWQSQPNKVHNLAWTTIEWKGSIHPSTGTLSLKVNGELLCTLTGQVTGTADQVITQAFIGCHNHELWFDDWWLLDQSGSRLNDFLGDRIIEGQLAIPGNGTHTEWTPSTGSDHGAMVDDSPTHDGDGTYNWADTVNLRDTYTFPSLARIDGDVEALYVQMVMEKSGVGARAVAGLARTGGSDFDHATDNYLAELYDSYEIAWPENPDTTDPWTVSQVNAAELGVKVTV